MKKRNFWHKLKTEYIGKGYSTFCGLLIVILTLAIIAFVASKGLSTFIKGEYPLGKFLFSTTWRPGADEPEFGAAIYILGSTFVSIGAVLISAPISVALAIFMNYISPWLGKKVLQPALELFVGIPSVVYGWIGISVLVPALKHFLGD